jgi:hypothetical protein
MTHSLCLPHTSVAFRISVLRIAVGMTVLAAQSAGAQTIAFRRAFAVGGSDDAALSHVFPQQVAADARGGFAILNSEEGRVLTFDSAGRRGTVFGRKGGGPGEMQFAFAAAFDRAGGLWVLDNTKRALVGFSPTGQPLPEVSTRWRGLPQRFAWSSDGATVIERTRADTSLLIRARGRDTVELVRFVGAPKRPVDREACGLIGETREPVFSPSLAWAAHGDFVAVIDDDAFKVTIVRASGARSVVRRPRAPDRATTELALKSLGGGDSVFINGRGWCATPATTIVAGAGVAQTVPAYRAVVVDAANRIWAVRHTLPGASGEADIYSIDKGFIATVSLGARVPVAFTSDGRMLSLEHDADGVPLIVAYVVTGLR